MNENNEDTLLIEDIDQRITAIKSAIIDCFGVHPVALDGGVLLVRVEKYNALVDVINAKN
jgi:hypothetical protein